MAELVICCNCQVLHAEDACPNCGCEYGDESSDSIYGGEGL